MDARELPSGIVTFLFTDVEGSTRLMQRLGPAFDAVLEDHRRLLRRAFVDHDGAELQTHGDGFFVAFSSADDAIAAAVDGQRALGGHSWPPGAAVRVRMGISSGEAVPNPHGDYVALAVNEAARIVSAAHAEQIIVSERTASLANGVGVIDLGRFRLRGFNEPVRLMQVEGPGLVTEFPEPHAARESLGNLLPGRTSFIGRDFDLALLGEHVSDGQLVTITGPGGAGKTRLAIETGRAISARFDGGVWFVDLTAASAGHGVAEIAVAATGTPAGADADSIGMLCRRLGDDRALLILDNCEHLLEEAARFVDDLLDAAPLISVVATSRAPLGVTGEQVWRIAPLRLPQSDDPLEVAASDAGRLFAERAALVDPTFSLAANSGPVADICRDLDGLPLAIELAAARAGALDVADIARSIKASSLVDTRREAPSRHETLRAAIDWSHDLLEEDERVLFRRLSAFVGGFTLDAAEEICGHGIATIPSLVRLLDHSLLIREASRYRMLETIRGYAADRLEGSGEAPDIFTRHATWFADFFSTNVAETARNVDWVTIDDEVDNALAALGRSPAASASAVSLATNLAWLASRRGHGRKVLPAVERIVSAVGEAPSVASATLLLRAGSSAFLIGGGRAREWVERATAMWRTIGERRWLGRTLFTLAMVAAADDTATTAAAVDEALAIAREVGDVDLEGRCLNGLGEMARTRGDFEEAAAFYQNAVELDRRAGSPMVSHLANLGKALVETGDLEASRAALVDAMGSLEKEGSRVACIGVLDGFASLHTARGNGETAASLIGAADKLSDALGFVREAVDASGSKSTRDRVRLMIDPDAFGRLVEEGAALSLAEASTLALS
jgi:predicted ATPase/class 3 adenylate cyclase